MSRLDPVFRSARAVRRAALIGYLPAGYPTVAESKDLLAATLDGGADLVEIGLPYSDPVMDGPTIQAAANTALQAGFRLRNLFEVVESVAERGGNAVGISYWYRVDRYGGGAFARALPAAVGLAV